jgi:hypothetical protein
MAPIAIGGAHLCPHCKWILGLLGVAAGPDSYRESNEHPNVPWWRSLTMSGLWQVHPDNYRDLSGELKRLALLP